MENSPGRIAEREFCGDLPQAWSSPDLWNRWKRKSGRGAKTALGGRSPAGGSGEELAKHVKRLERAADRKPSQIEILKTCGGSDLRYGALPGPRPADARLLRDAGGTYAYDQPLQSVLAPFQSRRPPLRRAHRCGVRRKKLPAVIAASPGRCNGGKNLAEIAIAFCG